MNMTEVATARHSGKLSSVPIRIESNDKITSLLRCFISLVQVQVKFVICTDVRDSLENEMFR